MQGRNELSGRVETLNPTNDGACASKFGVSVGQGLAGLAVWQRLAKAYDLPLERDS
jgi:hypothetical protein